MAGAYTDPLMGKVAVESYTQLTLAQEFFELPSAIVDSAELFLTYSYYYGNVSQSQTLNVYRLTGAVNDGNGYTSSSSPISFVPTPIGTATFNASTDSGSLLKIKITDLALLQSMLNGSKNNAGFKAQFPGIAIIPASNGDGAILKIDGGSVNTVFRIYYKQLGVNYNYNLTLSSSSNKFYRVTTDRSGTDIAALVNEYDEISSTALSELTYVQSLTGLRTKLSFPYLNTIRETFPNIAIMGAKLTIQASSTSGMAAYPPLNGLLLIRMENNKVKLDTKGGPFYVQPDNFNQLANNAVSTIFPDVNQQYSFGLRSYLQAVLYEQVPNNPILLSPINNQSSVNRIVLNDNTSSEAPIKLKVYFTTTK